MRIRFLRRWVRENLPSVEPGEVLEVAEEAGQEFIRVGWAVAAEPGAVEAATLAPAEVAARVARPERHPGGV